MDRDEVDKTGVVGTSDDVDSRCAVNSLILDYYKKFGRKRDLEQFFLLSTAQSEIKDKSSLFWRKMKNENDSSDSGGRKSDSPHEVCRISIRCSLPEGSSSQDEEPKTKNDSPQTSPQTVSPPIIIEEMPVDISRQTDEESFNLDDNNSQKSLDAFLDTSAHKPLSPTSSITSQRKLEWDSLADVGYANESDRKTSASSLSTLERLALKQQYSNNDSNQDIGLPTSHSTPLDENEGKSKGKKGLGKKTTKIYKKDVEFVEVNVPHTSDSNPAPSINVNLTKHISFNVEKDGGITVENVKRDLNISPEKVSVETEPFPYLGMDKEIQTSLTKEKPSSKEKSSSMDETPKTEKTYNQKIPVMISLNTLRKRLRRKKTRVVKKKLRTKLKIETKEATPQERSGEQLSEAESFEYMPGHMYNQNQMNNSEPRPDNSNGNKSSLESSGPPTTDSSKDSKHSLTKDLEKCVDLLKVTLQKRYDDGNTKKKLIKEIVQRLVNSRYRSDDTTTEFLSGLSYNSKMLGIQGNNTTTSTSDYTDDSKHKKPKKSILRNDKFNSNAVASTSQSAPNLYSASYEKTNTHLMKKLPSNTESDASSKGKTSSDNAFPKTSSEELYLKYLEALRREEAYKKHLKEKEMFLKQKLASSETVMKAPIRQDSKISNRLKDLMKDLTRNNYDDGSGDASKLEGGSSSNIDFERISSQRNQRSHSVFTLSSSLSDKRPNLKKNMQAERESAEAGPSKHHYCCCPHHYIRSKVTDSSVQVNIKHQHEGTTSNENDKLSQTKPKLIMPCGCKKSKVASPRNTCIIPDEVTGEIKYVCLCNEKQDDRSDLGENIRIYKCSRLTDQGVQMENRSRIYNAGIQCEKICSPDIYRKDDKIELIQPPCRMNTGTESSCSSYNSSNARRYSKSSQTNVMRVCYENDYSSGSVPKNLCGKSTRCIVASANVDKVATVYEGTRCLQTEISINPKISDPTLSDIVIINDCDCAKLISEQIRRVPIKLTEKSNSGTKTYSDVSTNSNMSDKLLIPSEDNIFKEEIKSSKINVNEMGQEQEKLSAIVADTNIPQHNDLTLRLNKMVDQGISTVKILNADETTSISDVCGKLEQRASFQSENNKKVFIKTSFTKKIIAENDSKCNTYPKKDIVKEKTPFKRANTDTGTLACGSVQTDTVKQKDRDANYGQNKCGKQNTTPETCENESRAEKSECGSCSQQTNEKFRTENKSLRKTPSLQNDKKDIGIQKDLFDEELKKSTNEKTEITGIITENDPKCNTYPKKETVKEKAPLKRTNTDTGTLVCSCVQTDTVKQKNRDTNYNQNKCGNQNTTPETCENESQAEKSGCCNSSQQTNEECRRDTDMFRKRPSFQNEKKDTGIQYDSCDEDSNKGTYEKTETSNIITKCEIKNRTPDFSNAECQTDVPDECKININDAKKSSSDCEIIDAPNIGPMESCCKSSLQDFCKDPVIDLIRDITRRYTKKDKVNFKNKKCFTEIMTVLNYLLETEESTDPEPKTCCSTSTDTKSSSNKYRSPKTSKGDCCTKEVNKSVQLPSLRKPNKDIKITDSSDPTCSSELPSTSTESAACKVLNKIKKECEKYHKKKCSKGMKCEITSSSTNCEKCKKVHHCACRNHKCKRSKAFEKLKKKCIAYNLIIQTSESVLSEETVCEKRCRPLKNIIVKVPKRQGKDTGKKETKSRTHQGSPCSPRCGRNRSKSCPDESETSDECARRMEMASVREYLEQNRPDFVEKTSQRQSCLKFISERRANERAAQRDLLSLHVEKQPDLTKLNSDELLELAQQIGINLRRKRPSAKFISEREMKKHSENIYKTLPEVVQKKEEKRKENIKKTNLLMANIFKKNLQKQALRGSVNLSNYNSVIKI